MSLIIVKYIKVFVAVAFYTDINSRSYMFDVNKCKTKAAYSAKLSKNGKLDLSKIKKKFEVVFYSPIVVVIKIQGCEIIVHKHGELLFKDCTNKKKIEQIAKKIYNESIL
jgi:hypothetical protein